MSKHVATRALRRKRSLLRVEWLEDRSLPSASVLKPTPLPVGLQPEQLAVSGFLQQTLTEFLALTPDPAGSPAAEALWARAFATPGVTLLASATTPRPAPGAGGFSFTLHGDVAIVPNGPVYAAHVYLTPGYRVIVLIPSDLTVADGRFKIFLQAWQPVNKPPAPAPLPTPVPPGDSGKPPPDVVPPAPVPVPPPVNVEPPRPEPQPPPTVPPPGPSPLPPSNSGPGLPDETPQPQPGSEPVAEEQPTLPGPSGPIEGLPEKAYDAAPADEAGLSDPLTNPEANPEDDGPATEAGPDEAPTDPAEQTESNRDNASRIENANLADSNDDADSTSGSGSRTGTGPESRGQDADAVGGTGAGQDVGTDSADSESSALNNTGDAKPSETQTPSPKVTPPADPGGSNPEKDPEPEPVPELAERFLSGLAPAVLTPQAAGVLAQVAPLDPAALERTLQQFLDQLSSAITEERSYSLAAKISPLFAVLGLAAAGYVAFRHRTRPDLARSVPEDATGAAFPCFPALPGPCTDEAT